MVEEVIEIMGDDKVKRKKSVNSSRYINTS